MRGIGMLALVALLVCGCASLDSRLVGKYKCTVAADTGYDGPGFQFVQLVGNALMSGTLELKSDRTFSIVMMGMPPSGKWSAVGNKVTLMPDAEFTKDPKPLAFDISDEVDTLTSSQDKAAQMVFKRER